MPAVPIIAAVTGASAVIGAGAAAAIGLGTVGAVAATAIGTGIVAGGMTALNGGDVGDVLESAIKGGATSYIGGTVAPAVADVVTEATGSTIAGNVIGNVAATAVTGGDEEAILKSGLLGGINSGIDQLKDQIKSDAFDNARTESGLAGQTSVTDAELAGNIEPYKPTTDFSINPDYSLGGTPLAEGMNAQGIQSTQVTDPFANTGTGLEGVFDYTLPPQDDGLGLTMNEGQVLGDENSFINQPAPNVDVTIPAPVVEDNKGLLNALDTAKVVAGGLLMTPPDTLVSPEEGKFGIVPVPSEWKAPPAPRVAEFTPLAPIDFGNKEMLRGTQWEQLLSPTYGQVTPMPTQTNPSNMTFDELTRILGGSRESIPTQSLSINDVIAGIQSQYGQTPQGSMGQKPA
jgi:hypothetical protein